jgi:hypothetical protein
MADLWPVNVTDVATYEGSPAILSLVLTLAEGSLDANGTPLRSIRTIGY